MIKATIILDIRRKTKKGFPVKIRCKRTYINLGIYQSTTKLKRTPEIIDREIKLAHEINYCNKNNLSFEESIEIIKNGINDDLQIYLLEKKLADLKDKTNIGILEFYDIIIAERKHKKISVEFYEVTKVQIKNFIIIDEPINNIDYEWVNKFILHKKNAPAGVMSYLKNLRAVYKEAQRRNSYHIKKDNPFLGIIKTIKPKDVQEVTIKDFKKLQIYTPNKFVSKTNAFKMQRNIDLWLFQFLIGGHDLIDIANLKNVGKRVKFRRYKNRNKPHGGEQVDNLLVPKAKEIYQKYDGFKFIPHPSEETKYKNFRNNYNRSLKIISKDLELTSILKSKTPRYVFRTFAGEMMMDTLVLMQLQGHKPTEVTFSYQRKLPNKIIDKQLLKMEKRVT